MGNYRSIPGEPLAPPWVSSLLSYILMHPRNVGLVGGKDLLLGLPQPEGVVHAPCCVLSPGSCNCLTGFGCMLLSPGLPKLLCSS